MCGRRNGRVREGGAVHGVILAICNMNTDNMARSFRRVPFVPAGDDGCTAVVGRGSEAVRTCAGSRECLAGCTDGAQQLGNQGSMAA